MDTAPIRPSPLSLVSSVPSLWRHSTKPEIGSKQTAVPIDGTSFSSVSSMRAPTESEVDQTCVQSWLQFTSALEMLVSRSPAPMS
jgi:hypothetical protein